MKKYLIIGIIIGFMVGASTITFAASEYVQAQFAKFNFIIDGEVVELEADPLVYQGTTYLPVRVMSNEWGYDVTYKAESRTIQLNKTETIDNISNELEHDANQEVNEEVEQIESEISIEHIDNQIEYLQGRIKTMERLIKSYPESGFTKEEYELQLQHWQDLKTQKEAEQQ